MASARALRDAEYEDDEPWPVRKRSKRGARVGNASSQGASALALCTIVLLLLAGASVPGSAGAVSVAPRAHHAYGAFEQLTRNIGTMLRGSTSVTLQDDFRSGLADWTGAGSGARTSGGRAADGWSVEGGVLRPGKLRLWTRSANMVDYDMEFSGEIEQKSLNWVFRAVDSHNYYATKLAILHGGTQPNASLVHYAMLGGSEFDRRQLPLPLTLRRGVPYLVRVSVAGDRFITSVDGQVVCSWTDNRLHRGGVGFFSDRGEVANLRWVTVSNRDSVIGRLLANFSLIVLPGPVD